MTNDDDYTKDWTGGTGIEIPYLSADPEPGQMEPDEKRHKELLKCFMMQLNALNRIASTFETVASHLEEIERELSAIRQGKR